LFNASWNSLDEAWLCLSSYASAQGFILWKGSSKWKDGAVGYKAFSCHRSKKKGESVVKKQTLESFLKSAETLGTGKENAADPTPNHIGEEAAAQGSEKKPESLVEGVPSVVRDNYEACECKFRLNVELIGGKWKLKSTSTLEHTHSLVPFDLLKYSSACRRLDSKVVNHVRLLCHGNLHISVEAVIAEIAKAFPTEYGIDANVKEAKILFPKDVKNLMYRFKQEGKRQNQAMNLLDALMKLKKVDNDFYIRFKVSGNLFPTSHSCFY
jgi:hypothetical protein